MHRDKATGQVAFKHGRTRNYVFLVPGEVGFELQVPRTDKPFMQGNF
jgi:hypothetical protein